MAISRENVEGMSKQDEQDPQDARRRRVLVGVDETEASTRAADFVNRFFAGVDAEVLAVNVASSPTPAIPLGVPYGVWYPWPAFAYTEMMMEDDESRHTAIDAAERTASEAGVEHARPVVAVGDPVEALLRVAEEQDVDLIVVGSKDRGLLERIFTGSVSNQLVREASRPVLVVP